MININNTEKNIYLTPKQIQEEKLQQNIKELNKLTKALFLIIGEINSKINPLPSDATLESSNNSDDCDDYNNYDFHSITSTQNENNEGPTNTSNEGPTNTSVDSTARKVMRTAGQVFMRVGAIIASPFIAIGSAAYFAYNRLTTRSPNNSTPKENTPNTDYPDEEICGDMLMKPLVQTEEEVEKVQTEKKEEVQTEEEGEVQTEEEGEVQTEKKEEVQTKKEVEKVQTEEDGKLDILTRIELWHPGLFEDPRANKATEPSNLRKKPLKTILLANPAKMKSLWKKPLKTILLANPAEISQRKKPLKTILLANPAPSNLKITAVTRQTLSEEEGHPLGDN